MWSPTHVQVLVKRAKGLNVKGKNGTNDAFVTIALGKEKYQTSVKEKATDAVEWCEQCELTIPKQGNTAEIVLTCLHRNFLGVDEFLGLVTIPLSDFDVYEKPKTKWYTLKCKPGQKKDDYRGDLEVRTSFTVKSVSPTSKENGASTAELSKKEKKGSLQSLHKVGGRLGGSLLSLGTKEKMNLKKLAKTVTHKVEKVSDKAKRSLSKSNLSGKDKDKDKDKGDPDYLNSSFGSSTLPSKVKVKDFDRSESSSFRRMGSDRKNRDPGVQSDDEDDMFKFDALSHRSSGSSLNAAAASNSNSNANKQHNLVSKSSTPMSGSIEDVGGLNLSSAGNDLYRKSFGTPVNGRKEAPNSNVGTPKSSRSFLLESSAGGVSARGGSGRSAGGKRMSSGEEPVLDEWEAKLLGKKGSVPFKSPEEDSVFGSKSNLSQISHGSPGSFAVAPPSSSSRSSTLERGRPEAMPRHHSKTTSTPLPETPSGRRKIIPASMDLESPDASKSVHDSFSSSALSPRKSQSYAAAAEDNNISSPHMQKQQQQHRNSSSRFSEEPEFFEEEKEKKQHKTIGLKLKNSYRNLVETGRTGSLFNLNQIGKGFKDKDKEDKRLSSSRDLRISNESIGGMNNNNSYYQNHSRNQSDGSHHQQLPPSGTRVVLGRETTPTPGSRIPKDMWDRFDGRSREDLIEMIVSLQGRVEGQAKKQQELEDYIDSLLTKVISNAPNLLQKNTQMESRYGSIIK